jgi:hypothetical protein
MSDQIREQAFEGDSRNNFEPLTADQVKLIIQKMSTKHCQLDPLPTWLVKECLDEILPIITEIVNLSLQLGEMPMKLKHASIKPLLKKHNLYTIKKNYRPVSNLTFLSKVIEGAVIEQLNHHFRKNSLQDARQSAYRQYHSTETLLTKIHNDIMTNMSKGNITMLVMLDLSAAFDTIDHTILLNRLQTMYGIEQEALKWFKSYLTGRTQAVRINNSESNKLSLPFGVPQGSKLGPVLFNAYIAPLSKIASKHQINDHKYADDEQLYLAFNPKHILDQTNAVSKMESCIEEIRDFLSNNKLCNNSEKTEFMLIGSTNQIKQTSLDSIRINNSNIKVSNSVKNLGVMFDRSMSMEKQVNSMCKKAYYNISNISKIRKSLNKDDAKTIVNALVTPHLDYGNGLLLGICKKLENKLQVAQNSAVRLIEKVKKYDNISQYRKNLHWLPIPARIKHKIMTTTWKCLHNQAPNYLSELVRIRQSHGGLRHANKLLLDIPSVNQYSNTVDKAFFRSAPMLWNKLPEHIRCCSTFQSFKTNLKTHLFSQYYT